MEKSKDYHRFNYDWTLKDATFTKDKGTVFSCFACGGGSTMGYKLAGFDVVGCNEIDPRMMKLYETNHHPRYSFTEPIQTFKARTDLPDALYHLDILDGSPPCSTFSMCGDREASWGVKKHFREGQAAQVLDTLFFDFIDLAAKLQPKVVIAENVKGLLCGNARRYVERIEAAFDKAGYYCTNTLLNAATMGVPQRRERVFFTCLRKDIARPFIVPHDIFRMEPHIQLKFNEAEIPMKYITDYSGRDLAGKKVLYLYKYRQFGDRDQGGANLRLFNKCGNFNQSYVYNNRVCCTIVAKESAIIHFEQPKYLGMSEVCRVSTFPTDYDFCGQKPHYVCGMSVPPVMMAQVATQVYEQWLTKR